MDDHQYQKTLQFKPAPILIDNTSKKIMFNQIFGKDLTHEWLSFFDSNSATEDIFQSIKHMNIQDLGARISTMEDQVPVTAITNPKITIVQS